jgi:2-succinyl-5-enolpyruvyl-6-hydroxy-3-cyclohexene-1-carboxylate synthase
MSETTAKIGVQILIEAFKQHGITDVVFSPGSRNAPLVLGIVGSGEFKTISLPDERSAAFFALGLAQQTKRPVPVMCTSGSALLNYAPAVAEAYYQRVPFLIVSADRPLEWIDQGDGQTINQNGVFSNFIDYQISLPIEPSSESLEWYYRREIHTALNIAKNGPTHINIPFEEPLYDKSSPRAFANSPIEKLEFNSVLKGEDVTALRAIWQSYSKKMIIIGQETPNARFLQALEPFLNDDDTTVLVENTSNIVHPRAIHCIDRALAQIENDQEEYIPELVISFGGAIISKKIKAFLRSKKIIHWRVGKDFQFMDTYQNMSFSIPLDAAEFLEQFSTGLNFISYSGYGNKWKSADFKAVQKHENFLAEAPFSDLKVMEIVHDAIPEHGHFHMGNSSVVRYAQLFDPLRFVNYWCNRGTSGIDGSVSTAAGAAYGNSNHPHTLIVGDISFFYDSNALWNKFLTTNLRIIVVHNGGGGIFKIIPGPDSSAHLNDYFVTEHNYSAQYICKAFDINYLSANTTDELEQALNQLYRPTNNNRPALLEVFTPSEINDKELKRYFNAIRT